MGYNGERYHVGRNGFTSHSKETHRYVMINDSFVA